MYVFLMNVAKESKLSLGVVADLMKNVFSLEDVVATIACTMTLQLAALSHYEATVCMQREEVQREVVGIAWRGRTC